MSLVTKSKHGLEDWAEFATGVEIFLLAATSRARTPFRQIVPMGRQSNRESFHQRVSSAKV